MPTDWGNRSVRLRDKPRVDSGAQLALTVPSEVNPGPVLSGSANSPTVPLYRMPVIAVTHAEIIVCDNRRLPLPTGSVQLAECFDVFEYVIDDQRLLAEVARILSPGGVVRIAIPNRHGLGRFDRLNAFRYLRDTTGRGSPEPALAEVGWRRHYVPLELTEMLTEEGFRDIDIQTVGIGIDDDGLSGVSLSSDMNRQTCADAVLRISGKSRSIFGASRLPLNLGARIVASAIRAG
jgi:SAM-dependent methyltransferase